MLFQQAVNEQRNGNLTRAEALYRQILQQDPNNFDALHMLAVVCGGVGKVQEAETLFRKALSIDPKFPPCYHNFGLLLAKKKEHRRAIEQFDKALVLFPGYAPAYSDRGLAFKELGSLDEGIANLNKAIALAANFPDFKCTRGDIFFQKRDYASALQDYDDALKLDARSSTAWCGRGNVFVERERFDEASAAYDQAIALKPDLAEAWFGRANVYFGLKHYDESIVAFDKAIALKSDFPAAWVGRGNVFFELRRFDEALASFEQALALKADFAAAWLGRANVHYRRQQYEESLAAYAKALSLDANFVEALAGRGDVLFALNRVDEAIAGYDSAIRIKPDYAPALSNKIFALDFSTSASISAQQTAREQWWANVGKPLADASQDKQYANSRDPAKRLVIGYVSADFRQHSAAFAFRPILCNHDKREFEVICYSNNLLEDEFTQSFKRAADRWRDAFRMNDDELARQVYSDGVDILVDLSGHSDGNRLKAFARKPAPVQITAWGHATGSGLRTIQYLFSDPVMIPTSVRHLFAEKIYDLPCAIIAEDLPASVPRGELPALKNGYCTFGVFNRVNKMSDEAVGVWARILAEIPDARLLMKDGGLDVPAVRTAVLGKFAALGIPSDRIECLGFTLREAHLAAYNRIDICLDPFPQNGGISTWEAIRMGVPVIAKLGETMASRVCGATLTSVGMSDWVARDEAGYVDIARRNANRLNELAALRRQLPALVANSPSGNVVAYTRAVEAAYRKIWQDYCAG